jgi:hypothetical protein
MSVPPFKKKASIVFQGNRIRNFVSLKTICYAIVFNVEILIMPNTNPLKFLKLSGPQPPAAQAPARRVAGDSTSVHILRTNPQRLAAQALAQREAGPENKLLVRFYSVMSIYAGQHSPDMTNPSQEEGLSV